MKLNVTFRHFQSTQNEFNEIAKVAADKFSKFYDKILSVDIEFNEDVNKKVHISVHVDGANFDATESSEDFKKSLAIAEDKIVTQIKKWKEKKNSHKVGLE
jgi:ribosomal subunit interface protein